MKRRYQLSPSDLKSLKIEVLENKAPCFTDDELEYYFDKNKGDLKATIYELLILKSEDSSISVSGLTTQDTSSYFKRLASKYKTFNSGILKGN